MVRLLMGVPSELNSEVALLIIFVTSSYVDKSASEGFKCRVDASKFSSSPGRLL